jgi:hypothetical protein
VAQELYDPPARGGRSRDTSGWIGPHTCEVEPSPRARVHEPVDATVDDVIASLPRRAKPARKGMGLVDLHTVPIHARVAACGEAGDPRTDDHTTFFSRSVIPAILSYPHRTCFGNTSETP